MESPTLLHPAAFHTTRWTRVCQAQADSEDGRRALADLCDAYYEPVLAFLRCELRDTDSAREMSHSFFAEMLAGGAIHTADRGRGRFRSYLLGAVKHFLSRHRESARRMKRGGGVEALQLDDAEACEVADAQNTPAAEFDRQWAVTVLASGLEALRRELQADGREAFFEQVKPLLTGDAAYGDQGALAAAGGMNLDAFRMAVHRLKQRLRQCVKAEVAGTLDDPAMVQEEMQALFAALGG
ncbi:sigma-70 family RNA polymerase sigma factor [Prosthecobacter sp.]|uniref:RNA polymerase sigma factor n=1 Tax=Prosthecobacter sp. TaxID=1965333 RepID=UPI002ABADEB2|nr:sigma-70 family RNA polymerase sigma factor [Prosthecobacter sp.]MDZ4405189.1 sigma-70 family RNA polymerase sigma factor [Prosthecobacter sp.]